MEAATRRPPYPSESLPAFTEAGKQQEGCSPLREREATLAQSGRALTRGGLPVKRNSWRWLAWPNTAFLFGPSGSRVANRRDAEILGLASRVSRLIHFNESLLLSRYE